MKNTKKPKPVRPPKVKAKPVHPDLPDYDYWDEVGKDRYYEEKYGRA